MRLVRAEPDRGAEDVHRHVEVVVPVTGLLVLVVLDRVLQRRDHDVVGPGGVRLPADLGHRAVAGVVDALGDLRDLGVHLRAAAAEHAARVHDPARVRAELHR